MNAYNSGKIFALAILMLAAQQSVAEEVCFKTSDGRTMCREVRPDGSAPPSYEKETVNQNDPNLSFEKRKIDPKYLPRGERDTSDRMRVPQ